MTPWKRFLLAAVLTTAHLLLLTAASLSQSISWLFWPSLAVRLVAILIAAPALAVEAFVALKLGVDLPGWACFFALHLTLPYIAQRVAEAFKVVRSPTLRSRRALFVGAGVLAAGATGVARETNNLVVRKQDLAISDLPLELSGLKIALLADLHRGPAVSQAYLEEVVDRVNSLKPDLVLMPGDFISKSSFYFHDLGRALKRLNPVIGSFATLGNHDIWEGREAAEEALRAAGVQLLQNRAVFLNRSQLITEKPEGLCLAGVDDLWTGKPDLAGTLKSVPRHLPVVLLSHNPDVAESLAEGEFRVDIQFSGHTHGGQIVLPGLGPVATASAYGTKYVSGWAQGPRWRVFTTVGVGTSSIPVRVGANPEIMLFTTASLKRSLPDSDAEAHLTPS